ncbi:MAG: AsmA family protein [Enterovibrio sp.]
MLKKFAYLLLIMMSLVFAVVAGVLYWIDPNDFKPLITQEVKKQLGRDLVIGGDIGWTFWPTLGLSVEQVSLNNPEGFLEPALLSVGQAKLQVAVRPLLRQQLDVEQISLHGARIFVQTLADGRTNLDGLGKAKKAAEPAAAANTPPAPSAGQVPQVELNSPAQSSAQPASAPQEKGDAKPWKLRIGEIDIQNASVVIRDDKGGQLTQLTDFDFNLEQFALDEWSDINFALSALQNNLSVTAQGRGQLRLAADPLRSELQGLTLSAKATDPTQNIALESATIAIDQFALAKPAKVTLAAKGDFSAVKMDTNANFTLQIDELMKNVALHALHVTSNMSGAKVPGNALTVTLDSDIAFDVEQKKVDVTQFTLAAEQTKLSGKASVLLAQKPAIAFVINSDELDLDPWLKKLSELTVAQNGAASAQTSQTASVPAQSSAPAGEKTAPNQAQTSSQTAARPKAVSDQEPDLSVLRAVDVAGSLNIKKLIAHNVKVSDLKFAFGIKNDRAKIDELTAKLYGGTLAAHAQLDLDKQPVTYKVSKKLSNVMIEPLIFDLSQKKILAGKGSINVDLKGVGLSQQKLLSGLLGDIELKLADGAIYGINIVEVLKEAKAALKGETVAKSQAEPKTEFSDLYGKFKLEKGVARTSDLHFNSPLLRIKSQGETNLITQEMSFRVSSTVVDLSKQDLNELKGLTIPVVVDGNWFKPRYRLDLKALLTNNRAITEKIRDQAQKGIDKLFGDNKKNEEIKKATSDLLNNLFN